MRREIAAEAGHRAGLAPDQVADVVRRVEASPMPTLSALEAAGFAADDVVLAASAVTGLPPAPKLLLRQPSIPADLDAIGIRDAGGTPLGVVQGRLWVAFSDPEAARASVFSDDVVVCLAVNASLAEARARFRREHPLSVVAATVAQPAISPAEVEAFRRRRPTARPRGDEPLNHRGATAQDEDAIHTAPVPQPLPSSPVRGPPDPERDRLRRAAQMGRLKRFRFDGVLGQGGMSTVYLAVDKERPGEPVAVKLLAPHLQDNALAVGRFRREVRALITLRHRHIVPMLDGDAETDGGVLWLATRYLDGGSLRSLLTRTGALPAVASLPLVAAILEAMAHAHAAGILHRDLKPENILLGQDGSLCVGDFGIAVAVGDAPLTQAGVRFGTPAYMSPEQAAGGDVDSRTDLFAVGVMLHELLTGTNPLIRATVKETLQAVARGETLPLPPVVKVPSALRHLRDALLAIARDGRPPDAESALRAIRPLLAHCPPVDEVVRRLIADPRAFADADDGDIDGETMDADATAASGEGHALREEFTIDYVRETPPATGPAAAGFDDGAVKGVDEPPRAGQALRAVIADAHSAFGNAPGARATMDLPMAVTAIDEPDPHSLPTMPLPGPQGSISSQPAPTLFSPPAPTQTSPPDVAPVRPGRGVVVFVVVATAFVVTSVAVMLWARS